MGSCPTAQIWYRAVYLVALMFRRAVALKGNDLSPQKARILFMRLDQSACQNESLNDNSHAHPGMDAALEVMLAF